MEKMLTDLAMPLGIVWLLADGDDLFLFVDTASLAGPGWVVCWLVLTVAGNRFLSNWLVSTLGKAITRTVNVYEMEPLDTIVLLGGGTDSRADGQAQLDWSGDRVSTAARLYEAGKATQFICTGSIRFSASENDCIPVKKLPRFLIGLGVPADQVRQLKGNNTFEEMQIENMDRRKSRSRPRWNFDLRLAFATSFAAGKVKRNGADPCSLQLSADPIARHPTWSSPAQNN